MNLGLQMNGGRGECLDIAVSIEDERYLVQFVGKYFEKDGRRYVIGASSIDRLTVLDVTNPLQPFIAGSLYNPINLLL